jgi:hypothetical protein
MNNPIIWVTQAGIIGVYPAQIAMEYRLSAIVSLPYAIDNYKIISGSLPEGLSFRSDGKISGTPDIVSGDAINEFVVRVTATDGNNTFIKDRTFSITVTGEATPEFTTPNGLLFTTEDSEWIEFSIEYNNPIPSNPILIRVLQGQLPPGLEINEFGLIRGYPIAPTSQVNLSEVNTTAIATNNTDNSVTVLSTLGFVVNRPIVFDGIGFGGIIPGQTYYIKSIINATQIEISIAPGATTLVLDTSSGFMDVRLPATTIGQPTKRQYNFTLDLLSPKGNDRAQYAITVVNQNLSPSQGGPGKPIGTRLPTILNTRPATYNITSDETNYGYYVLPPIGSVSPGITYTPDQKAYIGEFQSDNFFSFHLLGYDFDGEQLIYELNETPDWLNYDSTTGWIYGTPIIPINTIDEYTFVARVTKTIGSINYASPNIRFSLKVSNGVSGNITWLTDSNLGEIFNASISYLKVKATADVELEYEIISGNLPPNLTLLQDGEIIGIVAYQPTNNYQLENQTATFTFTIRAKATNTELSEFVTSDKTFTITVLQEYNIPTDNLYIKCTPNFEDRDIINSLLTDNFLIPEEYLYRPIDINFGKTTEINYAHAFGIISSNLDQYIEAVQKNHYWRDVTLGQLSTAVARDENNNIIYEVVYSNIIDNLSVYDSNFGVDYRYSTSIPEEIYWPRFIDLNLGPWYSTNTDIYTSFIFNQEAEIITNFREYTLLTQDGIPILLNGGIPTFYTSLSPGYARILYPNSLDNMRLRVEQILGANYNFRLLPPWMTSQQRDGNTLGFTPAWVIAYTKPAEIVDVICTQTIGIDNLNLYAVILDDVSKLVTGRPIIFSGNTFGNIVSGAVYYVKQIGAPGYPNAVILSTTVNGIVFKLVTESGSMRGKFDPVSYAEIIKERIENDWPYKLNMIDFEIDRFSVSKQLTYNYDTLLSTPTWSEYPSATPTPDPTNSTDFYVIFPNKTILPKTTQYNL